MGDGTQSFHYATEHRDGRSMTYVDGLSRCNMRDIDNDNSFETNLKVT